MESVRGLRGVRTGQPLPFCWHELLGRKLRGASAQHQHRVLRAEVYGIDAHLLRSPTYGRVPPRGEVRARRPGMLLPGARIHLPRPCRLPSSSSVCRQPPVRVDVVRAVLGRGEHGAGVSNRRGLSEARPAVRQATPLCRPRGRRRAESVPRAVGATGGSEDGHLQTGGGPNRQVSLQQ